MNTAAPFGLQPRYHPSGRVVAQAFQGGIESGYATSIYQGNPVIMATTGYLTIGTTNADVLGIFEGVEYTNTSGIRQYSKYWPASTVATDIIAYVYTDALVVYEVQANGSLAQTSIGDQADFVNPGSGSTTTGIGSTAISTTLAGAGSQAQLRIISLSPTPGNAWGDSYTNVYVQIARQQYVANKVAI